MILPASITPFLWSSVPLILGVLALSVLVWVRAGWKSGLTLAALGLGCLITLEIFLWILSMLVELIPTTWLIPSLITTAFIPAFLLLIKVAIKFVPKESKDAPLFKIEVEIKQKKLLIASYSFWMIISPTLIFSSVNLIIPEITPAEIATLRQTIWTHAVLAITPITILLTLRQRHHIKIYSNGIGAQNGRFYKWVDIEAYTWKFPDEYFQITLRNSASKKIVNIHAPHAYKQEIIPYLEQYIQHPVSA